MKDMCNLSYGVDQRGYTRGFNAGFDDGSTKRGKQCANGIFNDKEPIDKIIRYSGLPSERVYEICIAGGFING